MKSILVAYDSSEHAKAAFALALDYAQKFNAELYVITVARPPEPAMDVETEAFIEEVTEHYNKDFAHMKGQATTHKIKAHFEVLAGHPAQTIVHYAQDLKIDLIIIGAVREKAGLLKWALGSVASQVIHHAHCAVLVVR